MFRSTSIRAGGATSAAPGRGKVRAARARPLRDGVLSAAILLTTACASGVLIYLRATAAQSAEVQAGLLRTAEAAAALVDGDLHRTFSDPQQEDTPEYEQVIQPLRRILAATPGVRFLYTAVLVDDQVHFVLDATPPGDADGDGVEDHSAVMELYDDPDPEMFAALRTGHAGTSAQPYTDRWGTLWSGYAPIHDSAGENVGIVGVDITVAEYEQRMTGIRRAAYWGLVPALTLSFLVGAGVYGLRRKAARLENELRAAGDYNRSLIEVNPDPLMIVDTAGRLTDANAAALELVGQNRAEIIGQPATKFIVDAPELQAALTEALGKGPVHNREVRVRHRDGEEIPILYSASALPAAGGQTGGVCLSGRDMTELNAIKQQLEEACARAEDANRAKSEFLASMSHELRTPMTAILGYLDLLAESCSPGRDFEAEKATEHIETVRRNAKYLLELINDILDLSKIEAGKLQVETIACSPLELMTEIGSLMQVRAAEKGLRFYVQCDGPVPRHIRSDPTRLRQILVNLVGNAIKFTERGSVLLVCRLLPAVTTVAQSAPPQMQFEVLDTGIGLTPLQLSRMFQPFTQADASTARRFGGTGLGLTICRRLTELLGGTIEVQSAPGVGSLFRVTVATGPLDGGEMIAAENPAVPRAATRELTPPENDRLTGRILLAEDGPDNQRLISYLLRRAGADVDVAANGREAVNLALTAARSRRPYALILMDMQMPELDGYEATRELRKQGYSGPIVALTAHAMAGDRHKCFAAGCNGYATKPIDRRALLATIRAYLQPCQLAECAAAHEG